MPNVPPPDNYVCDRCRGTGHYKANCPTLDNPAYDSGFATPAGIPTSMTQAASIEEGTIRLADGTIVALKTHEYVQLTPPALSQDPPALCPQFASPSDPATTQVTSTAFDQVREPIFCPLVPFPSARLDQFIDPRFLRPVQTYFLHMRGLEATMSLWMNDQPILIAHVDRTPPPSLPDAQSVDQDNDEDVIEDDLCSLDFNDPSAPPEIIEPNYFESENFVDDFPRELELLNLAYGDPQQQPDSSCHIEHQLQPSEQRCGSDRS